MATPSEVISSKFLGEMTSYHLAEIGLRKFHEVEKRFRHKEKALHQAEKRFHLVESHIRKNRQ